MAIDSLTKCTTSFKDQEKMNISKLIEEVNIHQNTLEQEYSLLNAIDILDKHSSDFSFLTFALDHLIGKIRTIASIYRKSFTKIDEEMRRAQVADLSPIEIKDVPLSAWD